MLDSKQHFEIFHEIPIYSNYKHFGGVRIFDQTMLAMPNGFSTDTYNWKQFLGDEYEKKIKSEEYISYNQNWQQFQDFYFKFVTKFGGNNIIYIDDQCFQEPEDLFYQGKNLEEIIPELEKIGPLLEIEKLYNQFDEISNAHKYYGFKIDIDQTKKSA